MKRAVVLFSVVVSAVSLAVAEPSVSGVTVRQNWPWNGNVDILYTLSTDEPCDIEVTATWQGQPAPVMLGYISGDIVNVNAGNRHIVWDPVAAGVQLPLTDFRVTVTPATLESRKYLTLNLVDGSVAYSATEPDWRNNQAEFFYTNMIFRRISATSFDYGYPENLKSINGQEVFNSRSFLRRVTLSSDYYIAIFPTTTTQEQAIRGVSEYNDKNLRVPTRTVYNDIRGSREQGICWPETFHKMAPGSLLDKLRSKAKNFLPSAWKIDLPTGAQWENAARAGTDATHFCDMEGATFDKNLDQLNAIFDGKVLWKKDDVVKPGDLGQFNANSWGLYDTMGGIPEFILDWTRPSYSIDKEKSYRPTTAVTDPTGMATPDNIELVRQSRGGRNTANTKIIALLPGNAGNGYVETYDMGHRLCIHLKPITQIAD